VPELVRPGCWRLRLPATHPEAGPWQQLRFQLQGAGGPCELALRRQGTTALHRRLVGDEPVELLWPVVWMDGGLELHLEGQAGLHLRQLRLSGIAAAMAEHRLLLLLGSLPSPPELRLDASWPNQHERLEHIFRCFLSSPACNDLGPHGRLVIQRRTEDAPALAASHRGGAGPTISVVVPVYRPNPLHLQACISSIRSQSYRQWQLCLVDDHRQDPLTTALLQEAAASDPRIRVGMGNSNEAIAMATGDYIAFVDNDDMLAPDALEQVAAAIGSDPRRQLIYSDEDRIAPSGRRIDPHHKPSWNLELLRAHNYISHLVVVSSTTLRRLGGLRSDCEGAQHYDLLLRLSEVLQPDEIHHIPRILYHWRISPNSTASSGEAKTYSVDAGKRALQQHLERSGLQAHVETLEGPNVYRVRWPLPDPAPEVSIIIPTHNGLGVLKPCMESLQCSTYPGLIDVVVVDNNSNAPAITNQAVAQCSGEVVVLLNHNTAVISPNWLEELVSQASRPEVGCVGPKLLALADAIQQPMVSQEVGAVSGACLAIRRQVYEEVGGLDADSFPVAFNDVDFCLRVRAAGYRNIFTPHVQLYHFESKSHGFEDTPVKALRCKRDREWLHQRWLPELLRDPAYNPNFSLASEDFSLARPHA